MNLRDLVASIIASYPSGLQFEKLRDIQAYTFDAIYSLRLYDAWCPNTDALVFVLTEESCVG